MGPLSAISMKLEKGDVFRIETKIGYGFMQYVETDDSGIEYVRILEPISETGKISQIDIDKLERWNIGFPLKAAARSQIVERVGSFLIPKSFNKTKFARSKHNIRGEFLGWHIVNRVTLKRELKKSLSDEDLTLSPHGIMNDTLIIERLEEDWRLENWK